MNGRMLIDAERKRQIEVKGWDQFHDDLHGPDTLEAAADCYLATMDEDAPQPDDWPWNLEYWKPKSRERNLVRAGALYQAAFEVAERTIGYQRADQLAAKVNECIQKLDNHHQLYN